MNGIEFIFLLFVFGVIVFGWTGGNRANCGNCVTRKLRELRKREVRK